MAIRIPRNRLYIKTKFILKALGMLLTPYALGGEDVQTVHSISSREQIQYWVDAKKGWS